jgi:hypothetical protein
MYLGVLILLLSVIFLLDFETVPTVQYFYAPVPKSRGGGGILIYPCPSGYRYMVCPAVSSYSFGAIALIFCRMFIHIMEVCMSTGF